MTGLIKLLIAFFISLFMCGNAILSSFISVFCMKGVDITDVVQVNPIQNYSSAVGFADYKFQIDRNVWHFEGKEDGRFNEHDLFCLSAGNYVGYIDKHDERIDTTELNLECFEDESTMLYENIWGVIHVGFVSGGNSTTNYRDYILAEYFGQNPTLYNQTADRQAAENSNVRYNAYTWRDSLNGKQYTLETYTNKDASGCIYLLQELDYTLKRDGLQDKIAICNFDADKSYVVDNSIAGYTVSDGKTQYAIGVGTYEGDWTSGIITVDGKEYNMRGETLRILESQGAIPFGAGYGEYGYDTATKGGDATVDFAFGHRVISVIVETKADGVLRDGRVKGFSVAIDYNNVTDEEISSALNLLSPEGRKLSEEDFNKIYTAGLPYVEIRGGMPHYYNGEGKEVSEEEYLELTGETTGDTVSDDSTIDNSTSDNSTSENSISDNSVADDTDSDGTSDEDDLDVDETDTTGGDKITAFEDSTDITNVSGPDDVWFYVGGLGTKVTMAALDEYIENYSSSHTVVGSGKEMVYTVTKGNSTLKFTLSQGEYITEITVTY